MANVRSDFDELFFTDSELDKFQRLLARLRHFEGTVSRDFRALQRELREEKNKTTILEQRIILLEEATRQQNGAPAIDNEDDIEAANEANGTLVENEDGEDADIMMLSTFHTMAGTLDKYDGNPQVNFSHWCELFLDQIGLVDNLNEAQKLHRLKIALDGIARKAMERVPDPQDGTGKTLDYVLRQLKTKFPSTSNVVLAKQALTGCRQAPGEAVHTFANRLSAIIGAALSGKDDDAIEERLLDEFVERLRPELSLHVKSTEPTSYGQAFEAAIKKEAWMKSVADQPAQDNGTAAAIEGLSRRLDEVMLASQRRDVMEVAQQQQKQRRQPHRRTEKKCYYCHMPGHFINKCRFREEDKQRGGYSEGGGRQNWKKGGGERDRRGNGRSQYDRSGGYQRQRYRNDSDSRSPYRGRDSRSNSRDRDYRNRGGNSDHREWNNNWRRDDTPSPDRRRVRFREPRTCNIVRAVSPLFLVICMLIFPAIATAEHHATPTATAPMICMPDAPISYWRLPNHPICPSTAWDKTDPPIAHRMNVFRPNTVEYRTSATLCRCTVTTAIRSVGFFGARHEDLEIVQKSISATACGQMRDLRLSSAGELLRQRDFFGTNNSLPTDWGTWPFNIGTSRTSMENCFNIPTVVYTRFGTPDISMPLGTTKSCQYKEGSCEAGQGRLIWTPDSTQSCRFVHLKMWNGTYSNKIWVSAEQDFALSFANMSLLEDCGITLVTSDQGFAVPLGSLNDAQEKVFKASEDIFGGHSRKKRESGTAADVTTPGLVYSTELAARLTAIAKGLQLTTVQLFEGALRHVCSSLQAVADATMTLASANPTLLARMMLNTTYITAKLITADVLEVSPCLAVPAFDVHQRRAPGHCYDQLPVTFRGIAGTLHDGFLHPSTSIISSEATEMPCSTHRHVYLSGTGSNLRQFDQESGDVRFIPAGELHRLERFGRIDFPEPSFTIFRNQVLANWTELFTPGAAQELVEGAEINHHIRMIVAMPANQVAKRHQHHEQLAASLVTNGLFSFLKGGLFSLKQLWIFCCCLYTTWLALSSFIVPPQFAHVLNWLNIGFHVLQRLRRSQQQQQMELQLRTSEATNRSVAGLTQRYPSRENMMVAVVGRQQPTASATEGHFRSCLKGKINRRGASILVDTGANEISICDRHTASAYNFGTLQSARVPGVKGIENNGGLRIIGYAEVVIELLGAEASVQVHVVDNYGDRGFDLVLGTNAFIVQPENNGTITLKLKNAKLLDAPRPSFQPRDCLTFDLQRSEASAGEIHRLKRCLADHLDIFAAHDYDLGSCQFVAPTLRTTTENPITSRPYRTPNRFRDELKCQIEKMIEAGVLIESTTPWTSNVVIVQKRDGSIRTCVDFRRLNAVTEVDPFPLPRVDELLHTVAGHSWYTALDLANGFWQIRLDDATSHKCGVITEFGVFQMKRLPFGLKNAPSVFMRMMSEVLRGMDGAICYMDDVLIYTKGSFEEHLAKLREVFRRIRAAGLKLKAKKCTFGQRSTTFLGHRLSEKGYEPAERNTAAIEDFPPPTTVKELKRFLGLASFFRQFIPAFATISAPLNLLLKKKEHFHWGPDQQKAFNTLKKKLTSRPVLIAPDPNQPFHLLTDASDVAYGAALLQAPNGRDLQAVAFASRTRNGAERNYSATHAELAAIVWALDHFRPLIFRADLTVHTDHRPLTFLFSKASSNAKMNRWLLLVQDMEPRVAYIEGAKNQIADALSRITIPWAAVKESLEEKRDDLPYLLTAETTEKQQSLLRQATSEDNNLQWVIRQIRMGWTEEQAKDEQEERKKLYVLRDRLSQRDGIIELDGKFVIPSALRPKVLEVLHRAHLGMGKMKGRVRHILFWPGLSRDIEEMARCCPTCAAVAPAPPKQHLPWPPAALPWERVHIDFCGPFRGDHWLLIVDAFSKFPFAKSMTTTTSAMTADVLSELFSIFGAPGLIVSDNGPQFTSAEFGEFLKSNGTRHITTAPYQPSSNGQAENFVRTFKTAVGKMAPEGSTKTEVRAAVRDFLQDYRAAPHTTTGQSPASLFLKRELRTPLEAMLLSEHGLIAVKQQQQREFLARKCATSFEEGQKVWWRKQKGQPWKPGFIQKPLGGQAMFRIGMESEGIEEDYAEGKKHIDLHINQLRARRLSERQQNKVHCQDDQEGVDQEQ